MSEILIERFKKSIGKEIEVFLHNNFRFKGKITNSDDKYLEMLDYRSNSYKLIEIVDIKDAQIKNNEVRE